MREELLKILMRHEGLRLKPYKCTAGKITIGVGRNLDDVGITSEEALVLLINDIERVEKEAESVFKNFSSLNPPRRIVILCMIFNLGLPRFKGFKKFINFVIAGDYKLAAKEMRSSLWYAQVQARAEELAVIMEAGELVHGGKFPPTH